MPKNPQSFWSVKSEKSISSIKGTWNAVFFINNLLFNESILRTSECGQISGKISLQTIWDGLYLNK